MKKRIALLLALAMLFTMAACGANEEPAVTKEKKEVKTEEITQSKELTTRMFTDALGREVEIPTKVERIVPLGNTPRMIISCSTAGTTTPWKVGPIQPKVWA